MISADKTDGLFFVGIGGIGMSALARYFLAGGFFVAGYDRTGSELTDALSAEGCSITFDDDTGSLPELFRARENRSRVVIVYTPAIPASNRILTHFRSGGYTLMKRSEVLGQISSKTDTLAVAGTHGKTTVSTILAHILNLSHIGCSAFLGGISKNYNTNLLIGTGRYTVMEADEYDRSFLRLTPLMAIITSVDADHLDIYGDHASMIAGYNEFCTLVRPGGHMVVNKKIESLIKRQPDVSCSTYGLDETADYSALNITPDSHFYRFDLKTPSGVFRDMHFSLPGVINVENAVAASAVALLSGAMIEEVRKALVCFRGVRRRFDLRLSLPGMIYIDDYAHHPEEIRAFTESIREQYGRSRITGIFQPHLYTRTRDHAESFARALDMLDSVILMPVYPAREEPIPGVESYLIRDAMKMKDVKIIAARGVVDAVDLANTDVLVTIGAGDIDRLVKPLEDKIKAIYGK
ncbi:MAG: UDP-N-acetylmuramate--L-alanine ligase [Bacteroidales bacterium]|jgi:UDP-N-acetylmuramate--alanine ligase|nr:UDP-N-acetylmuramate--L-alanine ligase [Bacteroidales bacterium]